MRILFHSVKQNDICLMVSDTKLCSNVAKYGTKIIDIIIWTPSIAFEKVSLKSSLGLS